MEQVVAGPSDTHDVVHSSEPLSPPAKQSQDSSDTPDQVTTARSYSRKKMWLGIFGTVLFFGLTLAFVVSGLSARLDEAVHGVVPGEYGALLVFVAVVAIAETLLTAPLSYYSGYYLEHRYNLSNQSFFGWVREGLKGMVVSTPIALPILLFFFYCLRTFGEQWWLPVGIALFVLTVVLARLAPVVILPLFYKFVPLEEGPMRERILALSHRVGIRVKGVFTFNLSKNTKKANAALTGIGRSRRIILGDTLIQNFTDEEIETVFAHELGHHTMKHLWTMMAVGTVNSFLGLFVTAQLYTLSLGWLGFDRPDRLGALPLLTMWLGLYSLFSSPISNIISRRNEYAADRYAVRVTSNTETFTNALRKLARINLAETSPPEFMEFMFHSHPSIDKRIRAIESLK